MKTIKKDDVIKRVSNSEAHTKVQKEKFHYVSKSVWKKHFHKLEKPVDSVVSKMGKKKNMTRKDKRLVKQMKEEGKL